MMSNNQTSSSVLSPNVHAMDLHKDNIMVPAESEIMSTSAINASNIPAQALVTQNLTPVISLRRQKKRISAPISQKKPRSALPPEELDDPQLKGALSERQVPIPRQANRLKLLSLYTKHVLKANVPSPKPTLSLTPAEKLNADSLKFSSTGPPAFVGHIPPEETFHYSSATIPQLKAELLRHGIQIKGKKKKDQLRYIYEVEVLKVLPEEAVESTDIPMQTTISHPEPPPMNIPVNINQPSNIDGTSQSAGPQANMTPENDPLQQIKGAQTKSKYYKYKVMDLRKILKPFLCVVRGVLKDRLVELCDQFQPEPPSIEVTPYTRPPPSRISNDRSNGVAAVSAWPMVLEGMVHAGEVVQKMPPHDTTPPPASGHGISTPASEHSPSPDGVSSSVHANGSHKQNQDNTCLVDYVNASYGSALPPKDDDDTPIIIDTAAEGHEAGHLTYKVDTAVVDLQPTPNESSPSPKKGEVTPGEVTPSPAAPAAPVEPLLYTVESGVHQVDSDLICEISQQQTSFPPKPEDDRSTLGVPLSPSPKPVISRLHFDEDLGNVEDGPPKDWLCDSSEDESFSNVLQHPKSPSTSVARTAVNGNVKVGEHNHESALQTGRSSSGSDLFKTRISMEKVNKKGGGAKYTLKSPPFPRIKTFQAIAEAASNSDDASPLARNQTFPNTKDKGVDVDSSNQIKRKSLEVKVTLIGGDIDSIEHRDRSTPEENGSFISSEGAPAMAKPADGVAGQPQVLYSMENSTAGGPWFEGNVMHRSPESMIFAENENFEGIKLVEDQKRDSIPKNDEKVELLVDINANSGEDIRGIVHSDSCQTLEPLCGPQIHLSQSESAGSVQDGRIEKLPETYKEASEPPRFVNSRAAEDHTEDDCLPEKPAEKPVVNDLLPEACEDKDKGGPDSFILRVEKALGHLLPSSEILVEHAETVDLCVENVESLESLRTEKKSTSRTYVAEITAEAGTEGVKASDQINLQANSADGNTSRKLTEDLVGLIESLRLGQLSLENLLVNQASNINEGIERMDGNSREQFSRLDIKVSDLHEQMRQSALDMEQVMESVENLRLDSGNIGADSPGIKKSSPARSNSKSPSVPKSSRLPAVIRFHCSTLLGLTKTNKAFPTAATEEEKQKWLQDLEEEMESEVDSSGNESKDTEEIKASQCSKIIRRFLHKHGVKRFAPDFTQSVNCPENKFLWDLAVKLLVRLVECGEYKGVCLTETPPDTIAFHLRKHVKDCLKKRFRMQNNWSEADLEAHAKGTRRASRIASLRETRRETTMMIPDLEGFVEYVGACCSDNGSAEEESLFDSPRNSFRKRLNCNVLKLPWRSLEVERLLVYLDARKIKHDESSPTKPTGPLGRTRKRMSNNNTSKLVAPPGLPIDFYDTIWLSRLNPLEISALGIDINPGLKDFLAALK